MGFAKSVGCALGLSFPRSDNPSDSSLNVFDYVIARPVHSTRRAFKRKERGSR